MESHPLIFTGEMVRAIREGRKTATRRLAKNSSHYSRWKKGDLLWVRESFLSTASFLYYKADWDRVEAARIGGIYGGWKPPIHMPRSLSRIQLEMVSDARQETLCDMTTEDAFAEGFPSLLHFRRAWDIMHPNAPFSKNPTITVILFRYLSPGGANTTSPRTDTDRAG